MNLEKKILRGFPYHPFYEKIDPIVIKEYYQKVYNLELSSYELESIILNMKNRKKRSDNILSSGLLIDEEFDVFVNPEYGAFFYNTTKETIEEEITVCENIPLMDYHCYVAQDELLEYIDMGYEFVIGPSVKVFDDDRFPLYGVYCKNYNKTIEKGRELQLEIKH